MHVDCNATRSQGPKCLRDFILRDADLAELARQGFVSRDFRGNRGPYFKLRFRSNGYQRVRYLGCDPALANRIEQELQELQTAQRLKRRGTQLTALAHRALRRSKRMVQEMVESAGYRFHGLAIRRRRKT